MYEAVVTLKIKLLTSSTKLNFFTFFSKTHGKELNIVVNNIQQSKCGVEAMGLFKTRHVLIFISSPKLD